MSTEATPNVPRPFYPDGPLDFAWSRRRRPAARALWHWHMAVATPVLDGIDGAPAAILDEEQARVRAGEPLRMVPEDVWRDAYAACEHNDLNREWLALQVKGAWAFQGSTRFETTEELETLVRRWAVPHGRLLARLAGVELSVQLDCADELARGFFYLGRLLRLPADLARDRLFLPLETLRQRDVAVEELRTGPPDENVRGLLWRESVRVRDALAQGRSLMTGLSLRHRFFLKRAWMGAVELLDVLDRQNYDLWTQPPTLSMGRRLRVYLRTLTGRLGSR